MPRRPLVEPPTATRKRRYRDVEKAYERYLQQTLGLCSLRELKKTLRDMGGGSGHTDRVAVVRKLVEVGARVDVCRA